MVAMAHRLATTVMAPGALDARIDQALCGIPNLAADERSAPERCSRGSANPAFVAARGAMLRALR
jgi:hypothetical protein